MAKEGIKAREVKRKKLVDKYAQKRAELKAAGDYAALDKLPKKCEPCTFTQPLQIDRSSSWLHASVWNFKGSLQRYGSCW